MCRIFIHRKSTMMNVLRGETISNFGSVLIDEKDLTQQTAYQRAELIDLIFKLFE